MEFADIIRRRRSIRSYRREIPPPDVLDRIVDIARRSPTAGFSQGIDFLVLDDPDAVATYWDLTTDEGFELPDGIDTPPCLIIVWSDPERYVARYSEEDKIAFGLDNPDAWAVKFWDVDGGMAAMALQFAAINEGLDTWIFGISRGEAEVRAAFGIPDRCHQVGVVGLGYRSDHERPIGSGTTRRRRPLEDQLHRNHWNSPGSTAD